MTDRLSLEDLNGRKVMVLWSGGLDSTALLARLLAETEAKVFSHHVHYFADAPLSTEAETAAVDAITAWLRGQGYRWGHSESVVDLRGLIGRQTFASGSTALLYPTATMAGVAAQVEGLGADDFILSGRNCDEDAPPGSPRERMLAKLKEAAAAAAYGFQTHPAFVALNPPPSRAEALAALPEPLRDMVTSCGEPRRDPEAPTGFRPCGRCRRCAPDRAFANALGLASRLQEQVRRIRGNHSGSTHANR